MKLLCFLLPLFEIVSSSIVVNTWGGPFLAAASAGYQELQAGGNCLDAVEVACTTCEVNQCDGSVGYGNHPDTTGHVTLDALIMDGATMDVGSVAFLSKFRKAATVARSVMEYTAHTLLVGEGAEEFAEMIGIPRENTDTPQSAEIFESWKLNNCQPNFYENLDGCKVSCGPYPAPTNINATFAPKKVAHPTRVHKPWVKKDEHDTIGVVAIDAEGRLACGTTTNGASHKVRGRVGDSPIVGSGCYVNGTVGGCAATGDGDVMMRFSPTFAAVLYMGTGSSPRDAAVRALQPISLAYPSFSGGVVCLSKEGVYGAATYNMVFQISVMGEGMTEPQQVDVLPI